MLLKTSRDLGRQNHVIFKSYIKNDVICYIEGQRYNLVKLKRLKVEKLLKVEST